MKVQNTSAPSDLLLERTHSAGLRPEIEVADLALLFEMLQAVQVGDEARTVQLRQRFLALLLDSLHFLSLSELPGPAPMPGDAAADEEGGASE